MNPFPLRRRFLAGSITALLATAQPLLATTYTWTGGTNNNWNNAGNWLAGVTPAPVAGDVIDVSTLDLTANKTLNLNNGTSIQDRTAGAWIFGDTNDANATTFDWTVGANGGTGSNPKLILAVSSGTGTIQVNNGTTTINPIVAGTQGLTKTGAGTLALANAGNTLAGGIFLNAGGLGFSTGALNNNTITIGGNASLNWNTAGNVLDLSDKIILGNGFTLTLGVSGVATDNTVFASTIATSGGVTGGIIKGNGGILTITAAQNYTGGTRVNNGRMILTGGDNRLATTGAITFGNNANSGIIQLGSDTGASSQTISGLAITGTGTANAFVGGHTTHSVLTINNAGAIAALSSPIFGGTGTNENNLALVKTGAGSLSLSKNNSFTGNVDLIGGILTATNNNSLGAGAKTVNIRGTTNAPSLQLSNAAGIALASTISFVTSNDDPTAGAIVNTAGHNIIGGDITLADEGFGGGQTRIKVDAGSLALNGAIAAAASAASNRTLILDGVASGTANGIISDTGAIKVAVTKEGSGTWTFTAANSYTGDTTINGGRLNVSTTQTSPGAITVTDGTTLGVSLAAAGQTLAPSALTLNHTNAATALALDFGSSPNPTVPIITTGTFTTAGNLTNIINIAGTGLSVGTFDLIKYTGSIGGAGFAGLDLGSKPARVSANLVDAAAQSKVQLNISAFDVPRWTGIDDVTHLSNGSWDVNDGADPTTGIGTLNWKESTSGTATRYLQIGGIVDSVIFDDTATGETNVYLTTSLSPASVTVNNGALPSTFTYTFSGEGKLTGATSLLKTGLGTLILVNTGGNDYIGATAIHGGILQIGDGVLPDGGQLGSGGVALGAAGALVLNRPGDPGQDLTLANALSGTGTIIQQGGNIVTFAGNNSTFDGAISVLAGTVRLGNANALGSPVRATSVNAGATLDLTGFVLGEAVTLNGGTLQHLTGTSTLSGNITLHGGGLIDSAAGTLTLSGAISGTGGLVKNNAGNLVLSAAGNFAGGFTANGGIVTLSNVHSFSGGLAVNAGAVILSANQAYTGGTTVGGGGFLQVGASAGATVGAPGPGDIALDSTSGIATLTILRGGAFEFANNITSSGANATNAVVIGTNGAASLSGTVTLSGVNTFTGNITVNGGALRIIEAAALGTGPKLVRIGSNAGPALKLDGSLGNITLASGIDFAISSDGTVANAAANLGAIVNVSGDNAIDGRISVINGGGGQGRLFAQAGSLTVNGDIDADGATGARTLQLGGPATGAINGGISDFNSAATSVLTLIKDGSGEWALTGANTFTGNVTVSAGTLKISTSDVIGNAQSLGAGSGAVTIGGAAAAGTLDYTGSADATLQRAITVGGIGGGILKSSGSGLWTLSGILTRASRPLTFTGGAFAVTGQITGAASDLNLNGATVTLSATTNNYVGPTNVYGGGTLQNGAAQVLTNGTTVVLGEATSNTGGTYDLAGFSETIAGLSGVGSGAKIITNSVAATTSVLTLTGTSTFDGIIQDGGPGARISLTKNTGGILTLSGANTYTGVTNIVAGTISVGSLADGGSASGIGAATNAPANLVINGGTLQYTGALQSTDRNLTVGVNGGTIEAAGSGALHFTNPASITTSGTNTARTLTLSGASAEANTFGGVLHDNGTGAFSLVKSGPGRWDLTGASTFTGSTAINEGKLLVSGNLTSTASISVSSGATLGGSGAITTGNNGSITVTDGGLLEPGTDSASTFTLALGAGQLDVSLATAGAGWLKWELGTNSDQILLTSGTLNIGTGLDLADFSFTDSGGFGAGTYVLFDTATAAGITGSLGDNLTGSVLGYEAALSFADGTDDLVLTVGVVPEPGPAVSLLGGVALLLGWQRRRARSGHSQPAP